jgi:hypothetical protein
MGRPEMVVDVRGRSRVSVAAAGPSSAAFFIGAFLRPQL